MGTLNIEKAKEKASHLLLEYNRYSIGDTTLRKIAEGAETKTDCIGDGFLVGVMQGYKIGLLCAKSHTENKTEQTGIKGFMKTWIEEADKEKIRIIYSVMKGLDG